MNGCGKSGRDESRPNNAGTRLCNTGTHPSVGARFIAPDSPPGPSVNPNVRHRRSIRLHGYDYSQAGAYFVTICSHNRECFFGEVVGEGMRLNDVGRIVEEVWEALPVHFPDVELDAFVVMPNHVHGIVVLNGGAQFIAPHNNQGAINRTPTLGGIIRALKARCTHRINQSRGAHGFQIWQRNYYEHVMRNESSLQEIREYIANNPAQWAFDRENLNAVRDAGAMNRAPTGLVGPEV